VTWNHNTHYHRVVLDAVPPGAATALDVGSGQGLLAADLHRRIPEVTGIDRDAATLDAARAVDPGVHWVTGDVLTHPLGRFDVVASIAVLHHLPDLAAGLRRCAELVAPGGVLAVVGLARSAGPVDLAMDAVGAVQSRALRLRHGYLEVTAPTVWPPPHTYREARAVARAALPGCRWRRLPMFRYAVTWVRPPGPVSGR
jgi:trans-aconitate methyltransferase